MKQGSVVIEQLTSRVLANNPLGDSAVRRVPVYLPPSYDYAKRFPVIYLLAGFTGAGVSFLNFSFGNLTLPERVDALIGAKKMPEAIVVMPDCMTRTGGSQYLNSPATGNYADHLIDELIPAIDKLYATKPGALHRAVVGKSSGGYGALSLSMRYPDVFGAVGCHSGDLFFERCYGHDFPAACNTLSRYGGSLKKFFAAYDAAPRKPSDAFSLLNVIAMSAAYSPNPSRDFPENFDLPMDVFTSELRPDVWKRWLANDPVVMIEQKKYQAALKQLRLLFIDCGTQDEFHLHFGARLFTQKLKAFGVKHTYQEFPDTHRGIDYRYEVSLPLLAKAIS